MMSKRFNFLYIAICSVCLWGVACSQTANNSSVKSLLLDGFQTFQTFNEYNMKGEGEVVDTPFVYVKSTNNEIIIVPSNNIEAKVTYIYHVNDNYWLSGPEFWSSEDFDVYRYFFNDTIAEYRVLKCSNCGEISSNLFVKTKYSCVDIRLEGNENSQAINSIDRIQDICRNYRKSRANLAAIDEFQDIESTEPGYLFYNRISKGDSLVYQCDAIKSRLKVSFALNSLGEWGTQPCFDKGGSFVREDKPGSHFTRNGAYYDWPSPSKKRYVDESPIPTDEDVTFENGRETHYIDNKSSIDKSAHFALDLMLDEKANVVKVELRSSDGTIAQEKTVINQAYKFKYKSPAFRGGVPVKCWHWVEVVLYD